MASGGVAGFVLHQYQKKVAKEGSSQADFVAQIEQMHLLKEKGILTEEEFIQQKSKLLNQ